MNQETQPQTTLRTLHEKLFDGNSERTALALGRSDVEIEAMLRGEIVIDEDLEMKINGIAEERGVAS